MGAQTKAKASALVDLTTTGLSGFTPPAGKEVVWDRTLRGFGLRTRGKGDPATWSWIVQYRNVVARKDVKATLGRYEALPPDKARKAATQYLDARKVPGADLRDALTLKRNAHKAAQEAERLAKEAEAAKPTVGVLWDRYWDAEGKFKKSATSYEKLWKGHLKPAFEDTKVANLTPEMIEEFKAQRVATPGACNRALAVLSIMLTKAVAWGYRRGCAPEHPVKGGVVRRYAESKVVFSFTGEELGAILKAADAYSTNKHKAGRGKGDAEGQRSGGEAPGLAIRLLIVTGARASEVLTAHWGQFSEQPDGRLLWTVEATNTKGGRAITRSLDADFAKRLLKWKLLSLAMTAGPDVLKLGAPRWVFPNARDPSRPVPRIENAWRKIKVDAGLSRPEAKAARIHDIRHTVATLILQNNGGDLSAVKAQLGHATILTTQRYAHVMPLGITRTGDLMGGIAASAHSAALKRKSAAIVKIKGPVAQGVR